MQKLVLYQRSADGISGICIDFESNAYPSLGLYIDANSVNRALDMGFTAFKIEGSSSISGTYTFVRDTAISVTKNNATTDGIFLPTYLVGGNKDISNFKIEVMNGMYPSRGLRITAESVNALLDAGYSGIICLNCNTPVSAISGNRVTYFTRDNGYYANVTGSKDISLRYCIFK